MSISHFFAVLLTLTLSHFVHADSDRVCEDLHKLACAPGTYDDGTGSAHRPNDEQEKAVAKKLSEKAYQRFKDELQKPENTYLRKITLSATGLSAAPQCDGGEDDPTADCIDRMSQGAADIATKYLNGNVPSVDPVAMMAGKFKDVHYLIASDAFQDIKDSLLKEARSTVASESQEKKIAKDIFPKVQVLLTERIDQMVKNPDLKKKLIEKVAAIRFSGQDCGNSQSQNAIAGVLTSNAFYNQLANTFKYCSGFNNTSTSAFTIAFVIAHELSHSIDPCGITEGPSDYSFQYKPNINRAQAESSFPIGNAISCLRNPDSVAATADLYSAPKIGTPGFGINIAFPTAGGGMNPYGMYPYNSYGSVGTVPNPATWPFTSFCDRDQITESFADWMAMEILPDYIEKNYGDLSVTQKRLGYSNVYRIMCEGTERSSFDSHPTTELRANAIALVQPKVRQQMGCKNPPTKYQYCPPEGRAEAADPASMAPANPSYYGQPGAAYPASENSRSTK